MHRNCQKARIIKKRLAITLKKEEKQLLKVFFYYYYLLTEYFWMTGRKHSLSSDVRRGFKL